MAQSVTYRPVETQPPLDNSAPRERAVVPASNSKLLDLVFLVIKFSASRDPAISGHSINHGFTVADWTWFQRTLSDLAGTIQPYNNISALDPVFNALSTPGAGVLYQAFGIPSTTYAWTAVLQMVEEYHNINQAQRIGDSDGADYAKATLMQDATLAAGGAAFAGYRTTAIASAVEGVVPSGFNAPTILGRVTYAFVFIGIIFFTLCYLITSAVLGVKMYRGEKFKNELSKSAEGLEGAEAALAKFQFLKAKLNAPFDIHGELSSRGIEINLENIEKELSREALSYGTAHIEKFLDSVGEKRTPKQIENFLKTHLDGVQIQELGMKIKKEKALLKREAELARLTSTECVELIKLASQTPGMSQNVQVAVDKVEKALQDNRKIYAQVITACMMGAIFMVAGLIVTSGWGAILIAVAMVIVALAMIKLDSDGLQNSAKTEAPRKLDKTLVKISMALCVASLAIVFGLIMAGLIVGSPYVLAMSMVLTTIWLFYNIRTLGVIEEKERKFKEENPTLETFLRGLRAGMSAQELEQIFNKLPEEAKRIFSKKFSKIEDPTSKEAIRIALYTMNKVAALQQRRARELRLELEAIK